MEYSFQRYLLAKQTVDDRSLNTHVLGTLKMRLPSQPWKATEPAPAFRIIEAGAGTGTMLKRLIRWGVLRRVEYILVDEIRENIESASEWIERWAEKESLSVERSGETIRLQDSVYDISIRLQQADIFDFIHQNKEPADLLIANAFLDLLPMPESLPKLLSLTKGLAWLTINFDGVTTFEPVIDEALDKQIERLYHRTMDTRPTGGDSQSGRHLFGHLKNVGAEILAAGASDWVVYANDGKYPDDEKYFLQFILHFFEESLTGHAELDVGAFAGWLKKRHAQIESGELVYIAHQIDFLVKRIGKKSV